jgi:energy-coupling factor transporter ATP-binding protein EcfA2
LDEARADVLKKCYVYGRSINPLSKDMEDYFIDKLPYFAEKFKIKDIIERESKAGSFEKEYILQAFKMEKEPDKREGSLLVLLGGIGAGKSTFLLRFFRLVLHEHENLLWYYVDFKFAPPDETEIEEFILGKILEEWEKRYSSEIRPIIEGYGFQTDPVDKKNYFSKLFKLLHLLKFSITIVVDNVDRHDASFQEKIFLCCQHLMDVLRTITIVAMREETFILSTKVGIFDAYSVLKFHIAAPYLLEMITKRIEFTIGMIAAGAISKLLPRITPTDVKELQKYFLILKHSLEKKNDQSRKIVRFMHNVSVGNMREALEMFSNFIVSGNTNIDEIFSIFDTTNEYQIAYHQYVKSIMLGEYRYYMQSRSHIMNLYDFDTSISDSHFNLLKILHYLLERINVRSSVGTGYVDISDLMQVASSVFIKKEVIKDSLLRLSRFNLVEYDNQSKTEINSAAFVKITAAGQYYLKNLKHEFVYLDSVYVDSPISDSRIAGKLERLANSTNLESRLERVKIFVEYLNDFENDEYREHPEYLSNEFTNVKFAKNICSAFKNEEIEIKIKNKLPLGP